ncbi:MAG: beta-ketoacyl-ACP synthase III, partial [Pseudomonadota bacterium]
MITARIAATGLFTPAQSITNEELVASYNQYVEDYNTANSVAIDNGTVTALEPSSASFVEKASGIKSRFVMDRD